MFFRLFAIAVFILILGPVPVRAGDFQEHFVLLPSPKPVPALNFVDDKGAPHDLKEFHGRFVLLNLWATWCMPCVNEMPSLNKLQSLFDHYRFSVVALNEDRNGASTATAFMVRHSLDHLSVYVDNSGDAPSLLHARGFPMSILINPDGMEIGYLEGEADWMDQSTISFLRSKILP